MSRLELHLARERVRVLDTRHRMPLVRAIVDPAPKKTFLGLVGAVDGGATRAAPSRPLRYIAGRR